MVRESPLSSRPMGAVIQDSLALGEGMAQLPFKAASALLSELSARKPDLEQRVASLERRLGVPADPVQPPES